MSPALLWLTLHGVIDVIDDDVAAIEWQIRRSGELTVAIGYLPTSILPPGAREGDRIRLRPDRRTRRAPAARPERFIEIPVSLSPTGWRVVRPRAEAGVSKR
jgi:hypothetical protein